MKHRRKKPRFRSRLSKGTFPNGNPSWWNIVYHSRPRKRRDAGKCRQVKKGYDPDLIIWDLGNHKPTVHYW